MERRYVFLVRFLNLATGRNSNITWNGQRAIFGKASLLWPRIPSISSTSTHSCKIRAPDKSIGKKALIDSQILSWCRTFKIKNRRCWEANRKYRETSSFRSIMLHQCQDSKSFTTTMFGSSIRCASPSGIQLKTWRKNGFSRTTKHLSSRLARFQDKSIGWMLNMARQCSQ